MKTLSKHERSLQKPSFARDVRQTIAILQADMLKLKHNSFELLTRVLQPVLWLLIFGQSMSHMNIINVSNQSYVDFITPGILTQSILFAAISYGISLIWDKDMGILHKILVSPCPRVCLVIGRALAAEVRGLSQGSLSFCWH